MSPTRPKKVDDETLAKISGGSNMKEVPIKVDPGPGGRSDCPECGPADESLDPPDGNVGVGQCAN